MADGFSIWVDNTKCFYNGKTCDIEYLKEWEHYHLLLHRAMGKWNSGEPEDKKYISIDPDSILVSEIEKNFDIYQFQDYIPTPYLTAQEQALEAALEEVLK